MERIHYRSFNIAGFKYYDGPFAFKELEIGTELRLILEEDNQFDPYAIKIVYKDFHLGYVPRHRHEGNPDIYKLLKVGFDGFLCIIQRIVPDEEPENQIHANLYLISKDAEKKS